MVTTHSESIHLDATVRNRCGSSVASTRLVNSQGLCLRPDRGSRWSAWKPCRSVMARSKLLWRRAESSVCVLISDSARSGLLLDLRAVEREKMSSRGSPLPSSRRPSDDFFVIPQWNRATSVLPRNLAALPPFSLSHLPLRGVIILGPKTDRQTNDTHTHTHT
ncbi:hypothetical protein BD289DRAFT_28464 [Coniella lustricola]|uniref:Uncharacterized protein n=1 Tax=Coniella lustricola TaxID=2025994 RepID=A0A2T3AJ73_9PEZI|nr:hypothetical protein BD289DRAFT_28464 [Coniella lustricola]